LTRIIQLFIISALFLVVTNSNLAAKEVSGSLSAGEGSSFVPLQGSAFSIISDLSSGIYDGSFNILIRSGGKIIYQEKNQLDDLYLVFNEPIDDGDVIKLDVLKGVFIFKMSHMDTLPDLIVDAIKKQAPREYRALKALHKPRKKKPVKKRVIPKVEPRVIKRHIEPEQYMPKKEQEVIKPKSQPVQSKKEAGFFDSFSEKIGKLVSAGDKKDSIASAKPVPKDIAKPIVSDDLIKPATQKSGIDNISSSIDSINKEIASVIKSQNKMNNNIPRSGIEDASRRSKIETPKTSTSGIESLPLAETFPLDFDPSKSPAGFKSTIPKSQTKIDAFSTTARPTMQETQAKSFQTQISTSAVQKPKFQTKAPEPKVIVKKIKVQEKIPEPVLEEIIKVEPAVAVPKPIAPVIEPEIVKAPIVKREVSKDRIVITKTIAAAKKEKEIAKEEPRVIKRHVQPEDYKKEQEQIPLRMSERVAGNGYGMVAPGKLKVKAYSNSRPISAWVEVFKAGTSQRVKTFYTGKGSSLKDVKLPAGTYVIKATYRTAGSKRKKTIGRVVLEEGESINKNISFDDGVVTVKVKKSGKPIYAKVEVFKSGKKRRVAYEFTSKTTGIAKLSLGSEVYDIVVRDHGNVKRFNSIKIRGGKRKTLNANF
jgi:hypothetical protein